MLLETLQLTSFELVLSVFIIFLAYTVKGMSGFGSGLIAIPLLAFIFPLSFIVPVLGLLSYSGTIMQSVHLRKQVVWRDMLPLIPFSILGITIAIWLLVNIDAMVLVACLGVFILAYSIYSLLPLSDLKVVEAGFYWLEFLAEWLVPFLVQVGRFMLCI